MTGWTAAAPRSNDPLPYGDGVPPAPRALVESAVAVNEAPTVDRALAALTEAAQSLMNADGSVAILWEGAGELGVVRAASGAFADVTGARAIRTWKLPDRSLTGPPLPETRFEDNDFRRLYERVVSRAVVPLDFGDGAIVTVHVAWFAEQSDASLDEASTLLETLGRLTQIGARAESERKQRRDAGAARGRPRLRRRGRLDRGVRRHALERGRPSAPRPGGRRRTRGPRDRASRPRRHARSRGRAPTCPRARAPRTRPVPAQADAKGRRERVFQGTAAPVYASDGEAIGTVATFRDVTEEYNRTLLTERFLEQLFEALPIAVSVADPATGEILSVNEAFTRTSSASRPRR